MYYRRGDIYKVYLNEKENSSVQCGYRPVIIISNDKNNKFSPTVTIVALTSVKRDWLPVHVTVRGYGLTKPSTVLAEQIRTIDKKDLLPEHYVGHIYEQKILDDIVKAINIQISACC